MMVRAHVWVPVQCFYDRAETQRYCWLWLLRGDGQVCALQLAAHHLGCDALLPEVLQWVDGDAAAKASHPALREAAVLPNAPIVPTLRWSLSWGHPVQRAIRVFAHSLQADIMEALGSLEFPHTFFGTVQNYNRLACEPARDRRMQALAEFPAWLATVLLEPVGGPKLLDNDDDEDRYSRRSQTAFSGLLVSRNPRRQPRQAMEDLFDAIDHGRDLIGAIADYYKVDRALVRSPWGREPWQHGAIPGVVVSLLHALPAHVRPSKREDVQRRLPALDALPVRLQSQADTLRLAMPFKRDWNTVWRTLEREFPNLPQALRDCRDFLNTALETTLLPARLIEIDSHRLALAWVARRGLRALLNASRHWHALPLVERPPDTTLSATPKAPLIPMFGEMKLDSGRAWELSTHSALVEEGKTMSHCVGSYWNDCVREGIRIVHLETTQGEQATLQLGFAVGAPEPRLHQQQLSGIANAAPSEEMEALADAVVAQLLRMGQTVRTQLNRISEQVQREQKASSFQHAPSMRPLDARLRTQLAQVLDYAQAQEDWCVPDNALLLGEVAGFQHGHATDLISQLCVGDTLELVREPDNPHDPLAIRIDWNGIKLGYVRRADNSPIARLLDHGESLAARILTLADNGWAPVGFVVMSA